MLALNRMLGVRALWPYLVLGVVLWWLMLRSGVHATLAGVLVGFAVPFRHAPERSPAAHLEHALAAPVALVILPVFALANAGVSVPLGELTRLFDANVLGIVGGLVVGKPLGIGLACLLAIRVLGLQRPDALTSAHFIGAGLLGGIGFTMSIFIADLAFGAMPAHLAASKLAILVASSISAAAGLLWCASTMRRVAS
jgi:NhaA family Na+:H+ antiporter